MSSNKLGEIVASSWLIYSNCMMMHGITNFKNNKKILPFFLMAFFLNILRTLQYFLFFLHIIKVCVS